MILVEVVAGCVKTSWGSTRGFRSSKTSFTSRADVRQEAVAEPVHLDPCRAGAREEVGGARASLVGPRALRGEHDPVDLDLGMSRDESAGCVPPHPISMSSA